MRFYCSTDEMSQRYLSIVSVITHLLLTIIYFNKLMFVQAGSGFHCWSLLNLRLWKNADESCWDFFNYCNYIFFAADFLF